jgi:lipoate-protein ligase A
MNLLDLTLPSAAENLACDEALLDWHEKNGGDEILRFWESPQPCVVVGYANKVASEVNVPACEARGIPIFRRCSGGGTVLQGRGCLSYALILKIDENSPTAAISNANRFIMERNRSAIQSAIGNGQTVSVRGCTDLAAGDIKFSGNSQRRRKHYLLFHGTFLCDYDLALIGELLRMPSQEPDYRKGRGHSAFVSNVRLSSEKIKAAMTQEWQANRPLQNPPLEDISALVRDKYSKREWNFKF